MLIEKEVIGPGTVWSNDLKTGEPRKSVVTADHIKHWCEQGNKMLSQGLTVPVPCEHDFQAHPMTPAEKLKNNAGWVKEYKLKEDRLYSVIDIQDGELAKKLPTTVRWTSPWFSSFVDGQGNAWNNVIAHLALTTRPRLAQQAPFPSIAAAMDFLKTAPEPGTEEGYILSRAGSLKSEGETLVPEYPIAFSLYSGVALSEEDIEKEEKPKEEKPKEESNKNKLSSDTNKDMPLEKLLCDALCILGINMPETVSETEFKKTLYSAIMVKLKELSAKPPAPAAPPPAPGKKPQVQQESQPMYMNLEDIQKIPDETMRNIALSMYNENVKLQAALDKNNKDTDALRQAKLTEENAKRKMRTDRLSRISPRVKTDLDAMLALPAMALSLGDGGTVVDPMAQTLSVLENGLADIPALLQSQQTAFSEQPHPTDGELSQEVVDQIADNMARQMGCPPEQKKG